MDVVITSDMTISHIIGRLEGLSGTTRYDLDEACRLELKELAQILKNLSGSFD